MTLAGPADRKSALRRIAEVEAELQAWVEILPEEEAAPGLGAKS